MTEYTVSLYNLVYLMLHRYFKSCTSYSTANRQAHQSDPCLSKVLQYTIQSWPSTVPEQLKPYKQGANKLTIYLIVSHHFSIVTLSIPAVFWQTFPTDDRFQGVASTAPLTSSLLRARPSLVQALKGLASISLHLS